TTARIFIRPEAPMPFPLEDEVERLLALLPPPPSPLISLSPPSAEERLARAAMGRLRASSPSTHHPLHPSSPLPPPPLSLHLPPHVPTSLPLPSSPLPPLPASLFIPPPVNRREDILEAELPPRKRLCLTALTSRYEVGESSTAAPRPTGGHGIDYGFIGTLDAETRRQRAEEEQDTRDIYDVIEDTQDRQTQLFHRVDGLVSSLQGQLSAASGQIQALQTRDQTHADDHEGAASTTVGLVFSFLVSDNHNNMPPRRSSATARAAAAATPMTAAAVEPLIKARVRAMKATILTLELEEQYALRMSMESVLHISNCAVENQVKFATCTFLRNALTLWNSHMKTVT
ncbi:hypothetical protein Tco_0344806, partial [Tanacetum coccineum]